MSPDPGSLSGVKVRKLSCLRLHFLFSTARLFPLCDQTSTLSESLHSERSISVLCAYSYPVLMLLLELLIVDEPVQVWRPAFSTSGLKSRSDLFFVAMRPRATQELYAPTPSSLSSGSNYDDWHGPTSRLQIAFAQVGSILRIPLFFTKSRKTPPRGRTCLYSITSITRTRQKL